MADRLKQMMAVTEARTKVFQISTKLTDHVTGCRGKPLALDGFLDLVTDILDAGNDCIEAAPQHKAAIEAVAGPVETAAGALEKDNTADTQPFLGFVAAFVKVFANMQQFSM